MSKQALCESCRQRATARRLLVNGKPFWVCDACVLPSEGRVASA